LFFFFVYSGYKTCHTFLGVSLVSVKFYNLMKVSLPVLCHLLILVFWLRPSVVLCHTVCAFLFTVTVIYAYPKRQKVLSFVFLETFYGSVSFLVFAVPGIDPRALYVLGKHSTSEPHL
jgi:hypothetical protein